MNVYDFDETIYDGDCTRDFIKMTFKAYPKCFKVLPKVLLNGVLYVLKLKTKTQFKEQLYSYLTYLENIDKIVEEFVEKHLHKIKAWYYQQQAPSDLVISASPTFLVKAFCDKIKIQHVLASQVDPYTGQTTGENCYGEEKVKRFYKAYPEGVIHAFYSDSYSDTPLAEIAQEAYIVHKNERKPWNFNR